MVIRNALLFLGAQGFRAGELALGEDGLLRALGEPGAFAGEGFDAGGGVLSPGLVDIHLHGCVGEEAALCAPEGYAAMGRFLAAEGVTAFVPTAMSAVPEQLARFCEQTAALCARFEKGAATPIGLRLEGPFLNPEKRGAQPEAALRDVQAALFEGFRRAAGGTLRFFDLAPELPGALELIRTAGWDGVFSLAHTAADYETACAAYAAGVRGLTHMFNAMPPLLHRAPGPIAAAVEKACFAELICDGLHVHPAMVRLAFSLLGAERLCLISDATPPCGCPEGEYTLGGSPVRVREGAARLVSDGSLAGSVITLAQGLRRAIAFGVPAEKALLSATETPAKAAGRAQMIGRLAAGLRADLVLWDADWKPKAVWLGGKLLEATASPSPAQAR